MSFRCAEALAGLRLSLLRRVVLLSGEQDVGKQNKQKKHVENEKHDKDKTDEQRAADWREGRGEDRCLMPLQRVEAFAGLRVSHLRRVVLLGGEQDVAAAAVKHHLKAYALFNRRGQCRLQAASAPRGWGAQRARGHD